MTSPTVDVQCNAILLGIRSVIETVSTDFARSALDLDRLPASTRFDALLRLRDSLEQYATRSVDLFYVGLLGHFSAGKSSTINSILELWDTPDGRTVDLHPTDKQVTVIAHPQRMQSLLGIVQEGRRVVIRPQPVDKPFLEHIVLADTPGTGDPLLIQEMATDFLPICDLLLFLLPATSPLDTTDKPLLEAKLRRLPALPMKFVVTRGDEFRLDTGAPLTANNLNQQALESFLRQLVIRINDVANTAQYNASDVMVVCNKPPYYNIDVLRSYLLELGAPTNTTERLRIHSHKVHYFATASNEIRTFFLSRLAEKLASVEALYSQASLNVSKYDKSVVITNNRLTETWARHTTTLQVSRAAGTDKLGALSPIPTSIAALVGGKGFSVKPGQLIDEEVTRLSSKLFSVLQRQASAALGDHLMALSNIITEGTYQKPDSALLPPGAPIPRASVDLSRDLNSAFLEDLGVKYRRALWEAINGYRGQLTKQIEALVAVLTNEEPLAAFKNVAISAREVLAKDLENYFSLVSIYRTAVFSHQAREPVAKLGIGPDLGRLEQDFAEEDRQHIAQDADKSLFPDLDIRLSASEVTATQLLSEAHSLASDLRRLTVPSGVGEDSSLKEPFADLLKERLKDIETFIARQGDARMMQLESKAQGVLSSAANAFAQQIEDARKARKSLYIKLLLGGLIVGTVVLVGRYWFFTPVDSTIGAQAIFSLGTEVIFTCGSLLLAKLRDKFPARLLSIQDKHEETIKSGWRDILRDAPREPLLPATYELQLTQDLSRAFKQLFHGIPQSHWDTVYKDPLDELLQCHKKLESLLGRYSALLDDTQRTIASHLDNHEENITKLGDTSARIRATAIEPSFALLQRVKGDLEALRESLTSIAFA